MRGTAEISSYGYSYSIYYDVDYDIADTYTIPEGEEVVWILCSDTIVGGLQIYDGATWRDIEVGVGEAVAIIANKPLILPTPIYSFGGLNLGSVRVANPNTDNKNLWVCTRKWEQI